VVGLDGEGAEVGVRRRHELTGEEGNDGEVVPVEVRPREVAWERQGGERSSPGGRSGQWEADGGGPRRTENHRSGGRGRRCCSGLRVRAARKREGNGLSAVYWCY
jgi:hypothetical protein